MIFLYILAGIAIIIFAVLMFRVTVTAAYEKPHGKSGDGGIYLVIGPAKIKLYPKDKKVKLSDFTAKKYRQKLTNDAKKKPVVKPEKKDKAEKKDALLPGGIGETAELILDLVEKFTGYLRCEVIRLRLSVGTKDAASTAVTYAGVTAAAGVFIDVLDSKTELRLESPKDVSIRPDFDSDETYGDIEVKFSIRIINILRSASGFILNYLRTLIRLDRRNSNNSKNI